jgi:preprotein translocase subunit SecF
MKRLLFAIACVVLTVAGIFLTGKTALFLWSADKTNGTSASISGTNTTCGRKSSKRDCTQFHAQVAFTAKNGEQHTLGISAGSRDGHNVSIQNATAKIGGIVEVLYDPSNPSIAYDNSFFSIWFAPLASFAGAFFCIIPVIRRR